MIDISVIVPVYNVEKYLGKCIDTLIAQTFTNIEIILVDDGSTDKSGTICDEYALKDSRIIVIHKKNGGLSDARNVGIERAKGKYLGFVDSDDYIDEKMYEVLYSNLIQFKADMVMCGYYDCYENKLIKKQSSGNVMVWNNEEAVKALQNTLPVAWNKLYKRELFNHLQYPVGRLHEDTFIILDLLKKTTTVVNVEEPLYYYIRREASITKSKFTTKNLDILDAWKKCLDITRENFPNQVDVIQAKHLSAHFQVIDKIMLSNKKEYENELSNVKAYINKHKNFILKSSIFTLKRKLMCILLLVNENIYEVIIKRQNKVKILIK